MAIIRPFSALRPSNERASQVAAVPYDVVNTEEARALASGNPWSFLHVSRPEIDLPDGTPIYSDGVYAKAQTNFEKLRDECPLENEEEPSLYLYRLIMGNHEQIGVVACCSVDEYDHDIIRKHERTRRDKEDDRTRHILVLRAQTGPVFLTYRGQPAIDALVADARRASHSTTLLPTTTFVTQSGACRMRSNWCKPLRKFLICTSPMVIIAPPAPAARVPN